MTNETDSFVNEVDEGLRREQAVTLARRYGPYVLGAFVALLLVIGAEVLLAATRGEDRSVSLPDR